jgi:predicted membrane-bound spermidine synthase
MNRIENPARFLAQVEAGVILYSVLALALLASLYSASFQGVDPQAWRVVFLFLGSAAGFMVGLEFPLASKLFTRGEGEVGRTAGVLYAADLLGAWAGSLLVGVLLVPVLGILQTCAVIIFLKLASFFFLSASKLRPWGR